MQKLNYIKHIGPSLPLPASIENSALELGSLGIGSEQPSVSHSETALEHSLSHNDPLNGPDLAQVCFGKVYRPLNGTILHF